MSNRIKFTMMTREEDILNKTVATLKKHLDPQRVYLFGSRAKGTHRNGSDFDVAVTEKTPDFDTKKNITTALEKFAGLYDIDIVYLESVEEDFRKLILHEGKIVYKKGV